MLGNYDDAVDISQDAFVKAYHALESFKQESKFSTWLFGIANNACIDHLRKRTRRHSESLDRMIEDGCELPTTESGPETQVIRDETGRTIRDALSRLSEKQRAALVMFHYGGLSVKEISENMKRPEGTVKSDLHFARAALRRTLGSVVADI